MIVAISLLFGQRKLERCTFFQRCQLLLESIKCYAETADELEGLSGTGFLY